MVLTVSVKRREVSCASGDNKMTNDYQRRLLRIDDVVRETGASRSTVNRLIAAGTFARVKIGRATRITAESYDAWLDAITKADVTSAA